MEKKGDVKAHGGPTCMQFQRNGERHGPTNWNINGQGKANKKKKWTVCNHLVRACKKKL